jgi:Putative phage abortive infection protein
VEDDSYDQCVDRMRTARLRPGSPVQLIVISFLAILIWIFWAVTSSGWAYWAGAIEGQPTSLPVATAAAGAWGDSFGGFNALVGALGFGAVAMTLHLQYRSLERQNVDQHVARFEENFFRLVDLMRSLRENLKYEQTPAFQRERPEYAREDIQTGHEAIETAYNEVLHWVFKNHAGQPIRRKIVASQYENYVHQRFEWCFAPYFRIIYTILFNIENDGVLSGNQKAYYGNILRSQLTSFEIGLMAFNATSPFAKDLQSLITSFHLLKYLPQKRRKVLGRIFPPKAYAARS